MSTELRTRGPAGGLSRRGFLGAAALLPLAACRREREFTGGMVGAGPVAGHRLRDGGWPAPVRTERVGVVVVGAGIAGLAAARELALSGTGPLVVLELDEAIGGNSKSGRNGVSAYPWGAHYVPLVTAEATEVLALFRELGVVTGTDAAGRPVYREEFLCHDPAERLFRHGRWQEGLVPQIGVDAVERAELDRFFARLEQLKQARGADGRRVFVIPVDRSSRDAEWLALDRLTMTAWLEREGFRGPALRWYVNYCCRDDFGAGADHVSAWAGIHYFASRTGVAADVPGQTVVTWPEGNGWLVEQLVAPVRDRIRTGCTVFRMANAGGRVEVDYLDRGRGEVVQLDAAAAIFAGPQMVARHVVAGRGPDSGALPEYRPWLVANLTLAEPPGGRGAELAWDNVPYESAGLGYVVATHQNLHPYPHRTVLTYYRPLDDRPPAEARTEALNRPWREWCELILADLAGPHPELRTAVERIDIRVWGHGMVCPAPGYLWGATRERLARPEGRIHFAHSDLGGISIFEEAYTRGVQAGAAVRQLGS